MLHWAELLNNPKLIQNGLLINGQWHTTKEQQAVINPADSQVIAHVSAASEKDVALAIESAHTAFLSWREVPVKERSKILRKWYELILNNKDDLAKIATLECGKPLAEALAEVTYGASYLEWFSEEVKRMDGDIITTNTPNQRGFIVKEPIGVCAAITPWNFPSAMLTRKVAPAIAAGCAMVARPSNQTPLSALALGYLALEAGLPKGLFNVITGSSGMIAKQLTSSAIVRKLTFTGSTEVGMQLYAQSADTMKRLSLELGGNAPFIVFADANIDSAILGLIKCKFRNAGQTCVCANRIFIADSIYDEFITKLTHAVAQLKVGNGLEIGIDVGPLINQGAVKHAQELVHDAISNGAQLICGGKSHALSGNFFAPTILTECTSKMRIFNEELFAPIIAAYRFNSDEEVVHLANQTPFGLASYFYTNNPQRIFNLSKQLEYGMVGVNTGLISSEKTPFGGVKASGFGREGSKYGLDDYLNKKYICLDLN